MKKINIIKENHIFQQMINSNKYVKNKNFIIYYRNNELKNYRFGISVGKKIGNAVIRNKYKRKLRNIIDNNKKIYENNLDYIIILRKNCLNLNFLEMNDSFISLINNIKKEDIYEKTNK